ncbi:MAG: 3,4-dihydroxyphenylacetate 2,3-dioxygenase [Actinomycetota bacterium]
MSVDFSYSQPDFNITRAAHAEYVVTDLHRARDFYVDALGFVVSYEDSRGIYLRGYEERPHHSLILKRGDAPTIGHLAFRVATPGCLDALHAHYEQLGCRPFWIKDVEPGQGPAVRVQDPLGFPVEFFYAMETETELLRRYDLYRGAEVMRLDHFNLHVPICQVAFDYYKQLGFKCSEYTSTDGVDDKLWAAWLFRKPDVHDVALMNGRGPRLHHTGWWVTDPASVIRTCDRLAALNLADSIERGPGRHGLSNAFFLYLRDDEGHRVELYTSDYYTGDPELEPLRWSVNDPRRGTFWGHKAPESWFEESSVVAGYDGGIVPLRDQELTERPETAT